MTYRVRRQFKVSTFRVDGQLCKMFLDPWYEYKPGFFTWNIGFAVGKSSRQINDWYKGRKNKRARSLDQKVTGRSGVKTVLRSVEEIFRLRWHIEPGDCLIFKCTSLDPDKQFNVYGRWVRKHREWVVNHELKELAWYRPPYIDDGLRSYCDIIPVTPKDPLADTLADRYYDCFRIRLKGTNTVLSKDEILGLLNPAPATVAK